MKLIAKISSGTPRILATTLRRTTIMRQRSAFDLLIKKSYQNLLQPCKGSIELAKDSCMLPRRCTTIYEQVLSGVPTARTVSA